MKPSRSSSLWLSVVLALGLALLWQSAWVLPLKTLVVFFHEVSHLLTALFTGGEVLEMRIVPQQGGSVLTRGGMPFLILMAGYLGSLVFGVVLFEFADATRLDRWVVGALGLLLAVLTVVYMKGWYGWGFGLGSALTFMLVAALLGHTVNDLLLRVVGLMSMMYVPLDIWSDTLARPDMMSDARMLAIAHGGTAQLWGILWLLASVVVIGVTLWRAFHRPARKAHV